MANILTGIISLEAKGVSQTTSQVSNAVNKAEQSLKKLTPASNQATNAMTNLGRVVQDAPFGFIGIANNLNPLLESFQRLKAETGSTGSAFKSLGASLLGPAGIGFAISTISSLLIVFGDSLFSTSVSFSKAELAAARFANEIKGAREGIQQFNDYLNFQLDLSKLTNELNLGKGFAADQQGLRDEFNKNNQVISNSEAIISKYNKEIDNVRQNSKFFLGSAGQKLLSEFPTAAELPDNLIEKLNKSDKAILTSVKENAKLVQEEYKRASEADKRNKQIEIQLQINSNEEKKKLYEKQKSDYSAYVNDIISRGKELANYFKDVAIVPTFGIFDTKSDQFKKALGFINDIDAGQVKLKLNPVIEIQEPAVFAADSFGDYFSTELGNYFSKAKSIDFSLLTALQPKIKTEAQKLAENFGSILSNGIQDSFSSLGEGLGNALSGKDFGAGLTEALGSLLSNLGKALIQYGAIKEGLDKIFGAGGFAIPGAVAIGLGVLAIAAGKAISNFGGGRAVGGPVKAGTGYIVGENGPEYFQPGTNGSIIPNGRLSTMSGGGFAGRVVFEISGNKLIGVLANGNRSQGSLI